MSKKSDGMTRESLSEIPIAWLVDELSRRDGVEYEFIEPYDEVVREYYGPEIIISIPM